MKLHTYWRSSCAWRVRIALHYKNVDCEIAPVHLLRDGGEQNRPEFLRRNPLGQVPVLEIDHHGGAGGPVWLTQSMAILEYLEERYPTPPLLPRDLLARARVRQIAEVINAGTQPLQNMKLQQALKATGVDPAPLVHGFIGAGLRAVEQIASLTAGRFLVGDDPTLADVLLIPQLHASRRFGAMVDVGDFPTLLRVEAICAQLPAFQAAHADAQPDRELDRR